MRPSPELTRSGAATGRTRVEGHDVRALAHDWQTAATLPGACADPRSIDSLDWLPASVPGTAAAALRSAGAWRAGESYDFDAQDWWFRTSFDAEPASQDEQAVLCLDGIATVAEVHLNGEHLLDSDSMFLAHAVDVSSALREHNELAIRCHALAPRLAQRRRPRARWRTRLVAEGNLRFFRTAILGRAPGFSPGPAPVGPWREVRLERRRGLTVDALVLRPRLAGGQGRLAVRATLRSLHGRAPTAVEVELSGRSGTWRAPLELTAHGGLLEARGELLVPDVAPWWPHTHGEPHLHETRLIVSGADGEVLIDAGRVGFRRISPGASERHDLERDGLALHVNDVPLFARGCLWTPPDPVGLAPSAESLRRALEQVRDAGMNMLRVPGTGVYEEQAFHDLCDELGILVWQDFMFANLDYPAADESFRSAVAGEARQLLDNVAGRPSLAVLCGNSEIEQQVAMLGLDPSLGRGELFGELLPKIVRESDADAVYVPSAPCGGTLPFRTDRGIANYFGVGGYRRPLEDARRSEVRFASECLAFSNVPDPEAIEEILAEAPRELAVHHPRWKAGVPRDAGSGWDFEDVRDHYLELLFGVRALELRSVDQDRYLELSRAVTGEVMSEVFGEWRRAVSPCAGGLVLWLRDLAPGAGWGVIDSRGEPKVAYHYLRRALAPVAVWMTGEGLGGVDVHAANDGPRPLRATLRVALYRDFEQLIAEASEPIEIPPHGSRRLGVEDVLGHFVDASWAYRFGPPAQDVIVASLEDDGDSSPSLLSQSMHFPVGRPTHVETPARLGLQARASRSGEGDMSLSLRSSRLVYCTRLRVPGFAPSDDAFSLEPGRERVLHLRPRDPDSVLSAGELTALNLQGRVRFDRFDVEDAPPASGEVR
jgi:beta-mannosidase